MLGFSGMIDQCNGDRKGGSMKFYKVLNSDGSCFWGGNGKWFLPRGKRPGKWMPAIAGTLSACSNGYHVLTLEQLSAWLGPAIFEVEVRGDGILQSDKHVYPQARLIRKLDKWNDRAARIYACDCVERVLGLFENRYPADKRPRKAIETARLFAEAKASNEDLIAAWTAARDAAWDLAWTAAGAVALAAADAARTAAWAAACSAAWDAAWAVAWTTAEAARAAAWAAAWNVAWDAEKVWQTALLKSVLEIEVAKSHAGLSAASESSTPDELRA
jgi:hypothetical protein